MSEKIFDEQINKGWVYTLQMGKKAPAISKRIFGTLSDAQDYVNDTNDTAIAGILLSVVDDTEENNGIYFVKSVKNTSSGANGVIVKINFVEDIFKEIQGEDQQISVTRIDDTLKIGFAENAVFSATPID